MDTVFIRSIDTIHTMGNDNGSDIFSWAIPIGTFFLGYFLNFLYQIIFENREINRTKKLYVFSLKTLVTSIERQIEVFSRFIDSIETRDVFDFEFDYHSGFNVQNLKIISNNDLFKIFVLNHKGNDEVNMIQLEKYFDKLEPLSTIIEHSLEESISFLKRNEINEAQFLSEYVEMTANIENKIHEIEKLEPRDNFEYEGLLLMAKVVNDYNDDESLDQIHSTWSKYTFVIENLEKLENKYQSITFYPTLRQLTRTYNNWDYNRVRFIDKFNNYKSKLYLIKKEFENIILFLG